MSHLGDEAEFSPADFSGQVRLFPLPNLVLFPHVVQPLHIFEPRYVDMFHEAIAGDRLIAMALLSPGWEKDYEGRPPIEPVACLSRVLTWQAQENSRYNLLLVGVRRVRLTRELPPSKTFREAEAELLEDAYPCEASCGRAGLKTALAQSFERLLPLLRDGEELLSQLSIDTISLGTLTDVISYVLDMNVQDKQQLLSECDVDRRASRLLVQLKEAVCECQGAKLSAGFPPAFSSN
jgi:uncharacterized protein